MAHNKNDPVINTGPIEGTDFYSLFFLFGIYRKTRNKRDNLPVSANIRTSLHLSSEERKMLRKPRDFQNFKPHPDKKVKVFFDRMKEYLE